MDRADLLRSDPGLRDDPYQTENGSNESHADTSPNDPDLGEQAILKRQDSYQAFTISAGLPFFYTSNVALSRNNEQGDAVFAPAVGFTWAPRITPTLYANFSVGQQEFYYSDFNDFNFGSFDARAGLTYLIPRWHDLSLHVEYAFNRLTTDSFEEFFASHAIVLAAELPFRIGRAQQIVVGVDANFDVHSDPAEPGRSDYDGYVGYAVNLTRAVTLNAVGRLTVRDYTDVDRTDVSAVLSLGATYRFNRWLSLGATGTFAHNDSNRDIFDYNVVNIGGALSLAYRF